MCQVLSQSVKGTGMKFDKLHTCPNKTSYWLISIGLLLTKKLSNKEKNHRNMVTNFGVIGKLHTKNTVEWRTSSFL